ncbi:MAG TPA: bifunctional oligoribonuclease/PAP phosphatase NrnA, partial [bacterium]
MQKKIHSHRQSFRQIYDLLRKHRRFLIATHVHPDGDSISSVLLFAFILERLKKEYRILLDDDLPNKFDFLPGVERIERYRPDKDYD